MYTKTPAAVLFDFVSLNSQQVFFNAKPFFVLSGCILDCWFAHTNVERTF